MNFMEKIIAYLKQTYHPLSILVYGSYRDGTQNLNSDFGALVISGSHDVFHDTGFLDSIQLDVFVYPESYFEKEYDCDAFLQILDAEVILDTENKGANLKNQVVSYVQNLPHKTDEEIQKGVDWCVKMLARAQRGDAEGAFRWHWVLTDSLEIFCDKLHRLYLGPKKTLKWMETEYPQAFALYKKALTDFSLESLSGWIDYLQSSCQTSD